MPKPAHRWANKTHGTPAEKARRARYDSAEHRAARAQFRKLVEYGLARCWRPHCGRRLVPGQWHVGHGEDGVIRGPECASCNLRAAAIKGARVRNAKAKAKRFVRAVR